MSELDGWRHVYSGKVRDLYEHPHLPGRVLMVASDRVSAFDHVLEPGIPGKGELLTRLSLWWFTQLDGIPNHLVGPGRSSDVEVPRELASRSMLVAKLDMVPIECVVRGYLAGSGWAEYQRSGEVCGVPLPPGLDEGDKLPEPIFTPAFKAAQGEHDENITFERTAELVGEQTASQLRDLSLEIFRRASVLAEQRGVIVADTKFEFGTDNDGLLVLADEVLTSDSSRYWDLIRYGTGERTNSFDKQIVRDWLLDHWDRVGAPPPLPPEIVERTAARYAELIERLGA